MRPVFLRTALALLLTAVPALAAKAQTAATPPEQTMVVCSSTPGERQTCAAETTAGVTLVSVLGTVACEPGRTWDYDAAGVSVSDDCTAVFSVPKPEPPDRYGRRD